jgi:hypothetical protein
MASTTTGRSGIVKPKRRLWASANASSIADLSANPTGIAVSLPTYFSSSLSSTSIVPVAPCPRRAASTSSAASTTLAVSSSSAMSAIAVSTLRSRRSRVSARAMPTAESTPASGWMTTEVMPSSSATAHAC